MILVLNLLVAVLKLLVGRAVHSLAMVADGFHSLTDAAANVVGLVGVFFAARPADESHPYGHGKIETLSALGIGGLLGLSAWEVLRRCLDRLGGGPAPEPNALAFAVLVGTLLVNGGVTVWESAEARRLGSRVLEADAGHTRSDVLASLAVLGGLLAARAGFPQVDLVVALVVTVAIARIAFRIAWGSVRQLTDEAVVPAGRVRGLALDVDGVVGVHKVRTRTHPDGGHADLHVQVAPELRIVEAHEIGHRVVDRLRGELPLADVVVHVEPPTEVPPSRSEGSGPRSDGDDDP